MQTKYQYPDCWGLPCVVSRCESLLQCCSAGDANTAHSIALIFDQSRSLSDAASVRAAREDGGEGEVEAEEQLSLEEDGHHLLSSNKA